MILCDTGPLVALIDRNDVHHQRCATSLSSIQAPLLTTWPCFTEAAHLVHRAGGHRGVQALWGFVELGYLTFHNVSDAEVSRMITLMAKYSDLPMDLADASIVAAAESLGETRVFTVDSDFQVYRLPNGDAFAIVP